MTVPLWVLAIGSAVIGLPGSPWMHHAFQTFIEPQAAGHGAEHAMNLFVMRTSVGCSVGGIVLAGLIYLLIPRLAEILGKIFRPLYLASYHKLWFDELYQATAIRAWYGMGRLLGRFDSRVIDGAVNGAGIGTLRLSDVKNWIDEHVVDGMVNGVGSVTRGFSSALRRIQTGLIQNYLFILFVGVLIMIFLEKGK